MNQAVFLKKPLCYHPICKTRLLKKYGVFVRFLSVTCNFSFVGACTLQKSEIRCLQLPNQFTLSAAVSTPFWFCRYVNIFILLYLSIQVPRKSIQGAKNLLITSIISLYAILRAAGLQLDTDRKDQLMTESIWI